MSIFQDDDKAWSVWTKAMEGAAGDPGSPLIVQSPTVLRPLGVKPPVDKQLAWFRRLLVGDSVPPYGKTNPLAYAGATGNSVGESYRQYLGHLNTEVIKRFVSTADQAAMDLARTRYEATQRALTIFVRDANRDWKQQKKNDPALNRAEWDRDYGALGFTPQRNLLVKDSQTAYGRYSQLSNPYPQVTRVAQALARLEYGSTAQLPLPQSEDDLDLGREGWDTFYKTNIELGLDWSDFFSGSSPQSVEVVQASSSSSYYDHRWSVGGSVGYGFFSIGGGASGGTVESHLRSSTQRVKFSFERLVLATVVRGTWYDGGLVNALPYNEYVPFDQYWGSNGVLSLIPVSVLVARGLTVEIDTSQAAYDSFQSWHSTHGGVSFSLGPWRVGASGSSSTSWGSTSNTSSGSTIRLTDNSGQASIVAVISQKMDDLVGHTSPLVDAMYRDVALAEQKKFEDEDHAFVSSNRSLRSE